VLVLQTQLHVYGRTCLYYPQLLILLFILPHYHTFNVMFIFLTLLHCVSAISLLVDLSIHWQLSCRWGYYLPSGWIVDQERYSSFRRGIGLKIEAGACSLEECEVIWCMFSRLFISFWSPVVC